MKYMYTCFSQVLGNLCQLIIIKTIITTKMFYITTDTTSYTDTISMHAEISLM